MFLLCRPCRHVPASGALNVGCRRQLCWTCRLRCSTPLPFLSIRANGSVQPTCWRSYRLAMLALHYGCLRSCSPLCGSNPLPSLSLYEGPVVLYRRLVCGPPASLCLLGCFRSVVIRFLLVWRECATWACTKLTTGQYSPGVCASWIISPRFPPGPKSP